MEAKTMFALSKDFEQQVLCYEAEIKKDYPDMTTDVLLREYRGMSLPEYEKKRQETIKRILEEPDDLKKVQMIYELSETITKEAKEFAYHRLHANSVKTAIYLEVITKLLKTGKFSLMELTRIFPDTTIGDLYRYAEQFQIPVHLTEEEKRQIEAEIPEE